MKSQNFVPANKPQKTTKHDWWHYRWLEGRATLGACRTARLLHKGVLNHHPGGNQLRGPDFGSTDRHDAVWSKNRPAEVDEE